MKNLLFGNYYEIRISDTRDKICHLCNDILLYEKYINDNIILCNKCYKQLDEEDKYKYLLYNKLDTISFKCNVINLSLSGLDLISGIYNIKNLTINNTFISNKLILNCDNLKIYDSIINNNITFKNILNLYLINVKINKIDLLNNLLLELNENINIINLDIYIDDIFDNLHKPKLEFNISNFLNLEELMINFNKPIFNIFSFNLNEHIRLNKLKLKNIITYGLIENNLNITSNIDILVLDKVVNKKNYIEKLDFKNFNKLKILELRNMKINEIYNINNLLNTLILNKLKLEYIDILPLECEYIDLSNNNLNSIPKLEDLTKLTELDLNNNNLENIPLIPDLKLLNLSNNKIKEFPNINNISILKLSNNYINHLPSLLNIDFLDLSKNKIKIIDLDCDSNIYNLNLSKNKITNIISLPKKLRKLNCSYNRLNNINLSMYNLRELNIRNNNLIKLNIKKSFKIKILDCSYNNISNIFLDRYNNFCSLCHLNIKNNNIKDLYIRNYNNINYLNIKNNPLNDIKIINKNFLYIDKFYYSKNMILLNKIIQQKYLNKYTFLLFNKNNNIKFI